MNPLVSIVIPTWQRHDLLIETLDHIKKQTYANIEIIVVIDGQDTALVWKILEKDCKIVELGRNWSGLDKSNFGIAPLLVGYLMARGEYIMPWCDDERALIENHIEKLVYLMEQGFDFVYPKVYIWRNGDVNGLETAIIGRLPPEHGQITHYMFSPDNFIKYGFPDWGSHPVDWSLVKKWIERGASFAMLDEVTFEHRLDK